MTRGVFDLLAIFIVTLVLTRTEGERRTHLQLFSVRPECLKPPAELVDDKDTLLIYLSQLFIVKGYYIG